MKQVMKISARTSNGIGIIEMIGDVTGQAEENIVGAFTKLEKEGLKKFLLKFNEATYINSAGLAVIISVVADSKTKNQKIAACGLSKHFQMIFDMIGLTEFVEIYPTEEEAGKRL